MVLKWNKGSHSDIATRRSKRESVWKHQEYNVGNFIQVDYLIMVNIWYKIIKTEYRQVLNAYKKKSQDKYMKFLY